MESKQKLNIPSATKALNNNPYKVGHPLHFAWMEGVVWCTKYVLDGFKTYQCTDCGHMNFKMDNGEITVGFCDNCEHPLWNEE